MPSVPPVLRRAVTALFLLLCGAALLRGLWMFGGFLWYEVQPAHHGGDGAIYTAVGRGILHGLTPYVDLFETKPPGMFLISALSLWLSGSIALANVLQGGVELGIALLTAGLGLWVLRRAPLRERCAGGAFLTLFAVLLTLYLGDRSGHFQTESFGTFFVLVYVALLLTLREHRLFPFLASLPLAAAVGLKEPFLLIAAICAALLTPGWKNLLRTFLLPLGIGLLLGTIVLAVLGVLHPYLTVYLPEMIHGRGRIFPEPVWIYGFLFNKHLGDVAAFSPTLALLIPATWLASLGATAHAWLTRRTSLLLLGLLIALAALLVAERWLIIALIGPDLHYGPLLFPAGLLFIAVGIGAWFLVPRDVNRALLQTTGWYLLLACLTTAAMGMGGFLRQQMGFAAAVEVTLALVVLRQRDRLPRWVLPTLAVVAACGLLLLPQRDWGTLLENRNAVFAQESAHATALDNLLDACGWDRYLLLGEPAVPYALTQHSPYGPGFSRTSFVFPVSWRPPPIPFIQKAFRANIERTNVLIAATVDDGSGVMTLNGNEIPDDVQRYVVEHFSPVPPSCAQGMTPWGGILLLYRTQEGRIGG